MVGDIVGDVAGEVLLERGAPWQKECTLRQLQPMKDPRQSRDNPERTAAHREPM